MNWWTNGFRDRSDKVGQAKVGADIPAYNSGAYVRTIIQLNYHLHRIYIFSLPLSDTSNMLLSLPESLQSGLVQSSRIALKIFATGFDIWSSWDLIASEEDWHC